MGILNLKWFLAAGFLIFSMGIFIVSLRAEDKELLEITFLDVGQGDAILITSPSGEQMLVDAGPGPTILRSLAKELSFFDRYIDIVVATHADRDHIGGFPAIFDRFKIDYILKTNASSETDIYETFESTLEKEDSLEILAKRGVVIDLGSGVFAQVLFPNREEAPLGNEGSVVLQIVYGEVSAILTGDAPISVEKFLLFQDGESLKSNILKAGHHGSKTSTYPAFVSSVSPLYAIISAGENNSYGHPSPEVLETLNLAGVVTYGTYKEGSITFVSDGVSVWKK